MLLRIAKKHAAVLSVLLKEFENRIQDSKKKIIFKIIFATAFSVSINIPSTNFEMK